MEKGNDIPPVLSMFDQWMAEWMNNHPRADNILQANDNISTLEIMHKYFLYTGDESVDQEQIHRHLMLAEYKMDGGRWLVRG